MLLFTTLLALLPGLYSWWSGRTVLARASDPLFPELVFARMRRRVQLVIGAYAVAVGLAGPHSLWTALLLLLGFLLGDFTFRRALYSETWGVVDYVVYSTVGFVATLGFWMMLMFAPELILTLAAGWTPGDAVTGAAAIGVAVAAVLVVWEYLYPLLWLALHRASPIDRADLKPRLEDIVRRSGVATRPPGVFRFGAHGAYVMNAVALPSTRHPRVALSDRLLELLSPDEILAVFAHEVAHLEHYTPRRLWRGRIVTYFLVLGVATLPALFLSSGSTATWLLRWVWPVLVMTLLAFRMSKSQAHETESDRRAGELTGDPEAMVRALTKLHHYSRTPRRWPYDFERTASHPSLARRIQALRAQSSAGTEAALLSRPTVLRSTEPGVYVALDSSRAYWFDGVPADAAAESMNALREVATSYRSVAYGDLTELRVATGRGGARTLLARDRAGKTWSVPLQGDDVAAAQQALDVLDTRLSTQPRENWPQKARSIAAMLALALLLTLDFGWTWVALTFTLAWPSAAWVAAMGAMTVTRVLLGVTTAALGGTALGSEWSLAWISVTATFGIGLWACRLGWRWARGDERPNQRSFMVATLMTLAVLLVGALALVQNGGAPATAALQTTPQPPAASLVLLLVGVSAALVTFRDKLRRRSGAALGGLAVVGGVIAVESDVLTEGDRGPGFEWATAQADVFGRFSGGGLAYGLHLSPSGHLFALQGLSRVAEHYEDEEGPLSLWRFTIASPAGTRRTTEAINLAFLDDERLLVLRPTARHGDSLDLTVERTEGDTASLWRVVIPAYYSPTLAVDRASGIWRVTGHDLEARAIVTSVGRIGSDSITTARYTDARVGARQIHTYLDGTSVVTTARGSFGKAQAPLSLFGIYSFRWDLWRVADGGRQKIATLPGMPECGSADEREGTLLCVVSSRSGTTLWRIRTRGGRATPLGALPAKLGLFDFSRDGQLVAGTRDGSLLAVVDAASGRGTRVRLGGGSVQLQGAQASSSSHTTDVAIARGVLATLGVRNGKQEVVLYKVH